jgi:hypothetical protein
MEIGKGIYYILSNNTEVSNLVGNRIFPQVAPISTIFPFIIYDIYNDDPTLDKDGPSSLDKYDIRITGYAETYTKLTRVGSAIRSALDRTIQVGGEVIAGQHFQSSSLVRTNDEFDPDAGQRGVYRQELVFNVREIRS